MPPVVPNQAQRQAGILAAPINQVKTLAQQAPASIVVANPKSGAYIATPFDIGKCIEFTGTSPVSLTIAPNAAVPMPVGSTFEVYQQGAGIVTIAGGAGVTIEGAGVVGGSLTLAQGQTATLRQRVLDDWVVSAPGGGLTNNTARLTGGPGTAPTTIQIPLTTIVSDTIGVVINGDGSVTLPLLTAGSYNITVAFLTDTNYLAALAGTDIVQITYGVEEPGAVGSFTITAAFSQAENIEYPYAFPLLNAFLNASGGVLHPIIQADNMTTVATNIGDSTHCSSVSMWIEQIA